MRFRQGEILLTKKHVFGTSVWNWQLSRAVDAVDGIGLVLAMNNEDNRGWTRVLTPNGKLGFIHRNNLKRVK
jgi:hypothetical protein